MTTVPVGQPASAGRFARPADEADGIEAFARLLQLRDGYTARHSERVARLTLAVAERMGVAAARKPVLSSAARLHEIGKIGVPDRILLKDRPLDADEWEVMRCHAVWGAEALELVPGLDETATVVRFHHERWDGRGYPDGLAGDDIPLESRIIGACDAFCSMTADRPYRGALTARRARELLRATAAQHFDADVVTALLSVLDDVPELEHEGRAAPRDPSPPVTPRPAPSTSALPDALAAVRLPALEESRQRLLRALDHTHPVVARFVDLVASDPGLTAAVLRAAGAGGTSVPAAVEALGFERLATLTARVPAFDVFEQLRASVLAPQRFRLHAVATTRALRRLVRLLDEPDGDDLAAAALLHDVGKLVLTRMHPGYPGDLLRPDATPEERLRAERRALGLDHAVAGAALLRRWGLPASVTAIVAHHHDEGHDRAADLVRLADMLAHYSAGEPVDAGELLGIARRLGISPEALRSAMFELHDATADKVERPTQPSPLSARERDALRGLAEGKVYKEIAVALELSTSTVRSHLSSAYAKLGVADRAQAVLVAAERGWL
jgi:putative nucleotidyltransferase with HDIG domain